MVSNDQPQDSEPEKHHGYHDCDSDALLALGEFGAARPMI
jgi:hypothetical protein